ncbi:hypothetical protein [Stenotrophomonas oahuensis]|uniref:Uncharacterized protein n=1 Tax=Stenotrophomonas oahuensis TaxID=3003271 RepID=A0ABY9YSC1_9GAMM|nr:hypothetical protein [Stenotrophomonas sp. A5586]WNH53475.1 hypothetical protein PDM29_04125 [Stenotrophomonas sp. A5586]
MSAPGWFLLAAGMVALAAPGLARSADGDGTPFAVHGEQLQVAVPSGWKLAWMAGDRSGNGDVMQEYIPADQNIKNWRGQYLLVGRVPLPPAEVSKEVAAMGKTLPQMVSMVSQQEARKACGGTFTEIEPWSGAAAAGESTISGGFCDRFGPAAPFGEGALIGYLQGKQYVHRIEYHWRPASEGERNAHLPTRVHPAQQQAWIDAIKATPLCGTAQVPCKTP